jgi:arginine exporter protein ArgO
MSGRTWLMMVLMLGLNWGGFAFCLWYGSLRARR